MNSENRRFFVLLCLMWALAFFVAALVYAQNPPKKVSSDIQAKILRMQLQASRIQAQYNSCSTTDFQAQMNGVSAQVTALMDEAFKEAKLDKKEWDLNLDTFEFTKKAPPLPAPKPEEKKP